MITQMQTPTSNIRIALNKPQGEFLNMNKKYRAYVAGYGAGKTFIGAIRICKHLHNFPRVNAGYFAPTYPLIEDIFYPTIEEVSALMGFKTTTNLSKKKVSFYSGGDYYGDCICRSMDNPKSIVGFKIGHALVDELDTLPTNKADLSWTKIIARMRYNVVGLRNEVDVTTTPEGFRFVHKKFVKERTESYGIVHARTYDNAKNLPSDYIPTLRESYPEPLIDAYLNGKFVNLTSGTVYRNFNRAAHNSNEVIREHDVLYIGMDFNVGKMCAVVCVERENALHVVDQLKGVYDTPEMCRLLKERYPNHEIFIYPDASGGARKTVDASTSDITLLQGAGFRVMVNSNNPLVKDRVLSVNVAFSKSYLFVNANKCPDVVDCLEQQAYDDNGEPDKKSGLDHMNDALGYCVCYKKPIRSASAASWKRK